MDELIKSDHSLALLDELNIGAFTVGLDRRVRAMNYKALAMMGFKRSEVVGRDCREIFTGVPCTTKCILSGEGMEEYGSSEIEVINEDDSRHFLTRMAIFLYDKGQRPAGCLTVLQDHSPIADLIDRIHYEEKSVRIILDNLDVGIFTVNRGGYITFFNKEAEKITGYKRSDLLGKTCFKLFGEKDEADIRLLKESMMDGRPRTLAQGRILSVAGENVPVRVNFLALRNEKKVIVGGLVTFYDMTLLHQLDQAILNKYSFYDMIGRSPEMEKIFETVRVVAPTDSTVLLEGATGTGKDLLAKIIHSNSGRSAGPFVKVNCAAIPENLLESEMFGYARGAFTGAEKDKPGRFVEAHGGTIFLDEIGDMPLSLQAKLLRVLEDKEFYPLGSRRTRKVDVRIITATNRNLKGLVERGLFREDLFFRINVFRVFLPPLKNRRMDIPLLTRHILRRICTARGKEIPDIEKPAMKRLVAYDYPGNVRELENILEHALIICRKGIILSENLPDYVREFMPAKKSVPGQRSREEEEKRRIMEALSRCRGHRTKTARMLKMDRSTLWRKMHRYNIG